MIRGVKELDAAVRAWVDEGWICGAAAGIVGPEGTRLAAWGRTRVDGPAVDPANTVFSVASFTKIFASTILASLILEGRCSLETPIQDLLPEGAVVPAFGARVITVLDLVTHRSGLLANPPFAASVIADAGGKVGDRLLQFVAGYRLPRAPGAGYEYSNVGFGLLGIALARLTGQDFETMVLERIARPLALASTRVVADAALRPRVAQGYTADGEAVPFRDHGYAGASGSLRSTVPDLLAFLSLHLGLGEPPAALAAAARLTHEPRFETGPGVSRGLGWVVEHEPRIIWHTGAIGGCRSFFGFVPAARIGLVLLTNSGNPAADTLGLQALRAAAGLPAEVPRPPRIVALSPGALDRLAGGYRTDQGVLVRIARTGQRLTATGGPLGQVVFYPTAATTFAAPGLEGDVAFLPGHRTTPASVRVRAWGGEFMLRRIGWVAYGLAWLRQRVTLKG